MSEKRKASEAIGCWPSHPARESSPINLQGPAAQADARVKAGRASAKKKSATENRLIRLDGTIRVLHEVASELGVAPAKLAELYDRGMRTRAQIVARIQRTKREPA